MWMLYGAYGHTGRRIAEEAAARGLRPVLAGRNAAAIEPLAQRLGCPCRVFSIDSAAQIAGNLGGIEAVLHCAGPFRTTGVPMMDACLRAKVHYLDITGEIDVIEAAAERHNQGIQTGVTLLPSVGFDTVPSDCLAAMLAARLPAATQLQLAFATFSRIGPGTARTMVGRMAEGGRVRVSGRIVKVPFAWKTMTVPFHSGPQQAVSIPWGDVAAAWHSTKIPNIEVYAATDPKQIATLRRTRFLFPLLRVPLVRTPLGLLIQRKLMRRSAADGADAGSSLWGRVCDGQKQSVEATLETVESYRLTVLTALAAVEKVTAGETPPGFLTPSLALGREFILSLPDTQIYWQ
jgi:short subunit dehydrogenase-like uncharacterized protein